MIRPGAAINPGHHTREFQGGAGITKTKWTGLMKRTGQDSTITSQLDSL